MKIRIEVIRAILCNGHQEDRLVMIKLVLILADY